MPDLNTEFVTEFNVRCKVAQLESVMKQFVSVIENNSDRIEDHSICFERCSEDLLIFLNKIDKLNMSVESLTKENRKLKKQLYTFAHFSSNRFLKLECKVEAHEKMLNDLVSRMENLSLN